MSMQTNGYEWLQGRTTGKCAVVFSPEDLSMLQEALARLCEEKTHAWATLKAEGGRFAEFTPQDFGIPRIKEMSARIELAQENEPE